MKPSPASVKRSRSSDRTTSLHRQTQNPALMKPSPASVKRGRRSDKRGTAGRLPDSAYIRH
ncbi:hypothetical protein M1B74_09605 [Bacteroides pyogenes]|uniref:hypothetical protein n=1 Tax=Bacteroides pyogenes TaxID=310300 RepID=UPI003B432CFC